MYPPSMNPLRKQRGVGLIDVLAAVLVIGLGVAGLARLQGVAFGQGGTAKTRSIAMELARGKLDDLRSHTQLEAGPAGVFGYDEIADNAGGSESGGGLRLPSGTVTVGTVDYNRTWTATPYYFCSLNGAASDTNCAAPAAKARPDFYALRVTIAWTDSKDGASSQTIDGTVNAVDPLSGALALIAGASSAGPLVGYTPGLAPQVIAIDIGGSQRKETTNPTPTLNKKGQEVINVISRYETIRYSSDTNTITREEFATLNCSCENAGTGLAFNLRGQQVTKRIGVPSDQFQAPECEICCRDHHDDASCDPTTSSGRSNCYDPFRESSDYTGNDHNHYNASGVLANDSNEVYVEACRLRRVNGFLRVAQDWRMIAINNIPQSFFVSGGTVNDGNVTAYGDYVKDYIQAELTGGGAPAKSWSSSETVPKTTTTQLISRGIYLDYLDDTKRAEFVSRLSAGDETVFQSIPFYEVNLTKLARWNSGDQSIATVSNDDIVTETPGQNLYSRGLVLGQATGVTGVASTARRSNTGIISEFIKTDPTDGNETLSDTTTINVPGTTFTASGSITPTLTAASVVGVGSGGSSNLTCTYENSSGTFSCVVPSGWSGTIVPSATGYTFSPGSHTITNLLFNQSGISFTASTVLATDYTISGAISPILGSASVIAQGSGTSADGSCSYTSGSGDYSCTVPSGWSGTIIPSSTGFSFSPGSYNAINVTSNLVNIDFTSSATTGGNRVIAGTIAAAPSLSTVTVSATGTGGFADGTCTYTTSSGAYSCTVPDGWTGSVVPTSSTGIFFSPASHTYTTGVGSNLSNQDFSTSYAIMGRIFESGSSTAVISGVVVTAAGTGASPNGACAYDGSAGTYSCVVPGLWSGSVIPSHSSYSFSPPNRGYSNVTSPYLTENYTGTSGSTTTYTLTGSVSGLSNSGVATLQLGPSECTKGSATGTGGSQTVPFTCTVPSGWNGIITPTVITSGNQTTTFTPGSRTFSGVTGNQSGLTFSCSGNGC